MSPKYELRICIVFSLIATAALFFDQTRIVWNPDGDSLFRTDKQFQPVATIAKILLGVAFIAAGAGLYRRKMWGYSLMHLAFMLGIGLFNPHAFFLWIAAYSLGILGHWFLYGKDLERTADQLATKLNIDWKDSLFGQAERLMAENQRDAAQKLLHDALDITWDDAAEFANDCATNAGYRKLRFLAASPKSSSPVSA